MNDVLSIYDPETGFIEPPSTEIYTFNGMPWSVDVYATSWADAEARVAAMRATATVQGEIVAVLS